MDLPALQEALGPGDALDLLAAALDAMAVDPRVRAIRLHLRRTHGGLARLQDATAALLRFRATGRRVLADLDEAEDADLLLAATADRVAISPAGTLDARGLALRGVYLADALARLGVEVEVIAAGAFKSAGEPLARSAPSPAHREATDALVADLQDQWTAAVAAGRNMDPAALRAALARAPLSPREALEAGLVDEVAWPDEVKERLPEVLGFRPRAISFPAWSRGWRLDRAWRRANGAARPVAVVRLQGPITHRGPPGGSRRAIEADRVIPLLERLREDDSVRGVLLVVDSGGGGVGPSEALWDAVGRLREKRPVVALFRGTAASGAYALSLPAWIVAAPGTLTGSIGVLLVRPLVAGALSRLGLHTATWRGAPHADLDDPARPLSGPERARLEAMVSRAYATFLERVAEGRHMDLPAVEAVAGGRVWTGRQALAAGLVDRLGGFREAWADLCERVRVPPGDVPEPRFDLAPGRPPPLRRWLARVLPAPGLVADLAPLGALLARWTALPAAQVALAALAHGPRAPLAVAPFDVEEG